LFDAAGHCLARRLLGFGAALGTLAEREVITRASGMAQMIETPTLASGRILSPPLVPDEQPIDRTHLFRMTLGDHSLEREVLELFARQASLLIERMATVNPAGVATLAHTLKGSARGIGAWSVARAAEAVEATVGGGCDPGPAVAALSAAASEARAAIADLVRAH
jgi:HPt (histidine-containing phosphotransfer) domain-containing protein